jgi:hypothetical protein
MMKAIFGLALVAVLVALPGEASARRQLLTDEELDQVTARGVELTFNMNPDGGVDFMFNLGNTFGSGTASPIPTDFPSNLTVNANNLLLSQSSIQVENLILNMNICVQCNATTINQIGFGVGVTFKP